MPTYEYTCPDCGGFEALRALPDRNLPAHCPLCNTLSARVFASAPRLALLTDITRSAMDVNERARHEPKHSGSYMRLKHPAGCGCCKPGQRSATLTSAAGNKSFPTKRPWMISH